MSVAAHAAPRRTANNTKAMLLKTRLEQFLICWQNHDHSERDNAPGTIAGIREGQMLRV
jgi:hypothetical protein